MNRVDRVLLMVAVAFLVIALGLFFAAIWIVDPDRLHRVAGTGALALGVSALFGFIAGLRGIG